MMVFLLASMAIQYPSHTKAAMPSFSPKLEVLEIVAETGTASKLSGILKTADFNITTVPMKAFTAQREELSGKYDMIAIMDGNYTSAPAGGRWTERTFWDWSSLRFKTVTEWVTNQDHNTAAVMNDITNLKADEIIKDFINQGLPVLMERNSIQTGDKIKAKFHNAYAGGSKPNVILYNKADSNAAVADKVASYYSRNDFKQRPRFSVAAPSETKSYKPGEQLTFSMNVELPADVKTRQMQARLYIDSNFDDRYTAEEVVLEQDLTAQTSTISYTLPKGYSGVRYWKLELVDKALNLKSYQKGKIKFLDKTVNLKVLQVMKSLNEGLSLKNLTGVSLSRPGEYSISIDTIDIGSFNTRYHSQINGTYDMVIFGFADSYNNTNITAGAAQSVVSFINSKQGVMFTHDTVFRENNNWVNYFMDATGQKAPQTNLGLNAPNTSRTTHKVNEGLMTAYPYQLGREIGIALTHNQYYTLDLEDPAVIPWYNITGSSRDINDSWNHYYTYSKGNITYSGTGHTSNNFPTEEKELFVNTMYRAFLGSNHAPEITVQTPAEGDVIPANQNIELSYTIQDYDLKDLKASTKVFVNGKQVLAKENVSNGSSITASLPHDLPNGGTAVIKIQAQDANGAAAEKEISVRIEKITASLTVERTSAAADKVKVGAQSAISYQVIPQAITGTAAKAIQADTVTVSSLKLMEKFPAGLEVEAEGTKTGNAQTGITLERSLPDIVYTKSGDKFTAQPVRFTVKVTPAEKKRYLLNNSVLSYTDWTKKQEQPTFNPITLDADLGVASLAMPKEYQLYKHSEKNFSLDLKINPENAGIRDIRWNEESGGTILKLDGATGIAEVLKEGTTYVKASVTDVFGNVKEIRVPVYVQIPVNDFKLDQIELEVGETKPLPISAIQPEDGKSSLYIAVSDPEAASVNKEDFTITGEKPGTYELIVSGINSEGSRIEKRTKLTVKEVPVRAIIINPMTLNLNKTQVFDQFQVTIDPANATNKELVWTTISPMIAKVLGNGVIQGLNTGSTQLEVSTPDGKVKTIVTVNVGQPLKAISVPEELEVEKGKSIKIPVAYSPADATNITGETYTSNDADEYYVSVSQTGTVQGKRLGSAVITVIVTDDQNKTYTKEVKVKVKKKVRDEDSKY